MKILYIYPHPDDESFGPGHVMHNQVRQGHEVYLLTLTKGGATKKRFELNLSVEEMGEVRYKEMLNVEKVLKLSGMTVLDLPDSGLKELDPRRIEDVIKEHIEKIKPDVITAYAVHGISGFHDHLVTHAVVKRVFCEIKKQYGYLKRLALVTVDKETAELSSHFKLSYSTEEEIDCIVEVSDDDIEVLKKALDCYETYKDTIEKSGVKDVITKQVPFELFQEDHNPPIKDLFEGLNQTE